MNAVKYLFIISLFTINAQSNVAATPREKPLDVIIQSQMREKAAEDLAVLLQVTPKEAVVMINQVERISNNFLHELETARLVMEVSKSKSTLAEKNIGENLAREVAIDAICKAHENLVELRKKFKQEEYLKILFNEALRQRTGDDVDIYSHLINDSKKCEGK